MFDNKYPYLEMEKSIWLVKGNKKIKKKREIKNSASYESWNIIYLGNIFFNIYSFQYPQSDHQCAWLCTATNKKMATFLF